MRIKINDLYEHFPTLAGEQIHINHEKCPAGKDKRARLYLKRQTDGSVLAYCHNCGGSGVYLKDKKVRSPSIKELKASLVIGDGEIASTVEYPQDTELVPKNMPVKALAWLYKYRLTGYDIVLHGIGYNPHIERIIIPTCDPETHELISWQGRSLDIIANPPKYLTREGSKKIGHFIKGPALPIGGAMTIYIVEDVISAIRVSKHANAVALCGTNLTKDTKVYIAANYNKAVVLLDNDGPGLVAANTVRREMALYMVSLDATPLLPKQPKELSDDELITVLTIK
jgi:hypothetical protein